MLRSTTRQGTDYGAQRDLEGEGVRNDSRNRGPPEHRTPRKDPESDVGPRSRSSSRESKSSDSMGSPKGSPVAGKKLRKERIAEDIKREDDRGYARFKFLGGLKELGRMAPTTTEAVVAVANGPGLDKALLLDMGVPKDSIEKVMQIYLSCYGHFLTKGDKKNESHSHRHSTRRDKEGELKHSSRRHSDVQEHKEHRREKGERVNRSSKGYVSSQEDLRGYRGSRRADRDVRGRDLPVWTDATLKNLSYDGSTEWETFIHRFRLIADQMGLNHRKKAEFLVSTLQGDPSKAIMRAQQISGDLSFKEICSRLESRYEGDFSTPAAAWSKLGQAFQQREESLFHWYDRLNSIVDSIFRVDISGRNSIEPRLVSKFCFAAWDRAAGVKAMEQGPPKSLEEAVDSVRGYQHVQGAADYNCAERPRAKVRGWSPEREKLDCRDKYPSSRDDVDSRSDRYRGSSRAEQSQSAYRARSPEFRRYEGSLSRAENGHDSERDSRDKYQVQAVTGGLEAVVAELTKQVGSLTQELTKQVGSLTQELTKQVGGLTQELTKQVGGLTQELRGVKSRLDSMDSRLAKVEAWEGRFIKIEDRLDSVEKQLRERIESPTRRRSPSPGSRCFACGGEGHCRSECPRPPTLTVKDRIRCLVCREQGHNNVSCSRSGSHSSSPKGQGN